MKEVSTMDGYLTDELAWATIREQRELTGDHRRVPPAADRTDSAVPQETDGGAVVAVRDLRKTYAGGVKALKGISFEVREGEIFGMLGPNGAGKTTTIGVLTTTVRPSSGSAVVAGHDVVRDALGVRREIGVVFQESVLDNDFSALDNLRLHARLWRAPRRETEERIASLLDVMELSDRAKDGVRTYSGGMKRRLEIARALLAKPSVLFLDEPTVGLDPAVRSGIWELIQRLRRAEGATILLSTHYLEEAESVCDRVAIVHHGEIVALDSPKSLLVGLGPEVLEVSVDGETERTSRLIAEWRLSPRGPLVTGNRVSVALNDGQAESGQLVESIRNAGIAVAGVTVRRSTLNDVFLHLTGTTTNGQNGS
jgi:ABC-2 type transport system ATP-binding protein